MSGETIYLRVSPLGQTTIEAEGFEGEKCIAATSVYERMFRKEVKARESVSTTPHAPDMGERVR